MAPENSPPKEDAQGEAEKPHTPFTAAATIVRQTNLVAVDFESFSAQKLEGDATEALKAVTSFLPPTVEKGAAGLSVKISLLFRVSLGEEPGSQPLGIVRATISTKYTFKADAPSFSDEELNDFALCYGPFHSWGYWREYVQSSLARLDLPRVTVPLFLISQAPTMVQSSLE